MRSRPGIGRAAPRAFAMVGLTLVTLAAPVAAQGPKTAGVYRIGFLNSGDPERESFLWEPLREGLRRRGWIEGQTILFDDVMRLDVPNVPVTWIHRQRILELALNLRTAREIGLTIAPSVRIRAHKVIE